MLDDKGFQVETFLTFLTTIGQNDLSRIALRHSVGEGF